VAGARVVVLADDLIWSTRLLSVLSAIGAEPVAARTVPELDRVLPGADRVVVDLTATSYDPIASIEAVAARGLPILAVGQHDDHEVRKRALEAGAQRVFAYRKLFEDGPATLGAWLAR
jgi:hypothetical protein